MYKCNCIIILSVVLVLSSCNATKINKDFNNSEKTTLRQALDSNLGLTAADLVSRLGPPHEEKSDYNGGKILIYKYERTGYHSKGPKYIPNEKNPAAFKLDYSNSIETYKYDSVVMFWINKDNIIYKWSSKGFDLDEEL